MAKKAVLILSIAAVAAIGIALGFGRAPWAAWGASASAAVEIHYAPAEDLERIDVGLIDAAGVAIDMTAYVLTDRPVIEALAEAAARGVKVRIWRDGSTVGYGDPGAIAALTAAGAEARVKPGPELMHLKSYCVDGSLLRSGAANFSAAGEKRQDNDLIVVRGAGSCVGFAANFERLWNGR